YGPDPWSQTRILELGSFDYMYEQLDSQSIDDSELELLLLAYPSLQMDLETLFLSYHSDDGALGTPNDARRELRSAKILRAVYSRRQLTEVLTDFWFNHFNVDASGNSMALKTIHYEAHAIRPHILGQFEDLLLATARHPAMLEYLDNQVNFRDGLRARGRLYGLNENYAREIMELHTLGVEAGYTQDDVIAVARAFTGWTTSYAVDRQWRGDGFVFLEEGHDQDEKIVMRGELQIEPNGGENDGIEVIQYLSRHPVTAERICRKLVERFLDEDLDESARQELITELQTLWLATEGDLLVVSRRLFEEVVLSLDEHRSKVKRPLHFAASAVRAGRSTPSENPARLANALNLMGENLYMTAAPTGLPEESAHWASSGALLLRLNGVASVIRSSLAFGFQFDVQQGTTEEIVDGAVVQFTPSGLTPAIRQEIIAAVESMSDPTDIERTEVAATLVLSTPEFFSH
ncbi:MAG: DUF1800 domain-containing protein, partial [Myxococcota bacterium]|nr:DUF1800 domain-containing protein [Myxococcota bacterium]